jgi:hypothetical protein
LYSSAATVVPTAPGPTRAMFVVAMGPKLPPLDWSLVQAG